MNSHSLPASNEVLQRCEYLLTELRAEPKGIAWETKLSAAIALLRSVGHVLEKVDCKRGSPLREAQCNWWDDINRNKEKHAIFWEFVEEERNLILKQGMVRAGHSAMITLSGVAATALAAGQAPPPPSPPPPTAPPVYSYHMNEGNFTGRDPHDLIEAAILWWREQLETIEGMRPPPVEA